MSDGLITSAKELCGRLQTDVEAGYEVTAGDVDELRKACLAALSSVAVAEDFATTVEYVCSWDDGVQLVLGMNGLIETVLAVVDVQGVFRADVAARCCDALRALVHDVTLFADILLLELDGLAVILTAMRWHPSALDVQINGCNALCTLAKAASPAGLAVMREAHIAAVLKATKAKLPAGWEGDVEEAVDQAVSLLADVDAQASFHCAHLDLT